MIFFAVARSSKSIKRELNNIVYYQEYIIRVLYYIILFYYYTLTRRQAGELEISQVKHLSLSLLSGHQRQGGRSSDGSNSRWVSFSYSTRQGRGHIMQVPVRCGVGTVNIMATITAPVLFLSLWSL